MRATLRASRRTGGDPVRQARRRRGPRRRPLVVLCDISGSMEPYSRAFLHRRFTIVIGIFEATSIERRVKKIAAPRPLTHDLLVSILTEMGGELRDIYINELRDGTYFAKLRQGRGNLGN